jgi:hypothetical protein
MKKRETVQRTPNFSKYFLKVSHEYKFLQVKQLENKQLEQKFKIKEVFFS